MRHLPSNDTGGYLPGSPEAIPATVRGGITIGKELQLRKLESTSLARKFLIKQITHKSIFYLKIKIFQRRQKPSLTSCSNLAPLHCLFPTRS